MALGGSGPLGSHDIHAGVECTSPFSRQGSLVPCQRKKTLVVSLLPPAMFKGPVVAETHSAVLDPEKKSLNFIFPTIYVIPKSLKFGHWLSEERNETIPVVFFCDWPIFSGWHHFQHRSFCFFTLMHVTKKHNGSKNRNISHFKNTNVDVCLTKGYSTG